MAAWVTLALFGGFVGNTRADDAAALQAAINLGCQKVEEACGAIITTTVTDRVDGGGYELPLSDHAVSLTSVATWPNGTVLDVSLFVVEDQLLFRRDRGWIDDDLTVAYTAGSAEAPPWAVSAACLIGQQWFKSRLQPGLSDPTTQVGFLVPRQAEELMTDHLLAPDGF